VVALLVLYNFRYLISCKCPFSPVLASVCIPRIYFGFEAYHFCFVLYAINSWEYVIAWFITVLQQRTLARWASYFCVEPLLTFCYYITDSVISFDFCMFFMHLFQFQNCVINSSEYEEFLSLFLLLWLLCDDYNFKYFLI